MADAGYTAENKKSPQLQEVEDDATYITNKRFQEHYAEQARTAEKLARQEAKSNSEEEKKGN